MGIVGLAVFMDLAKSPLNPQVYGFWMRTISIVIMASEHHLQCHIEQHTIYFIAKLSQLFIVQQKGRHKVWYIQEKMK